MKLSIIGTGYVGLVNGACFAEMGHQVLCLDHNSEKIAQLKAGKIPIYEAGLEQLVHKHLNKNLFFSTDLNAALAHSPWLFLALPTPGLPDGNADLSLIFSFLEQLKTDQPLFLVIKSTVPVGTAAQVQTFLTQKNLKNSCVISNPEFLKEGVAVQDALFPTRIVVGATTEKMSWVQEHMNQIYQYFTVQGIPILYMDNASAELSKYAANTFLATKISFINQMAEFAEKTGADIQKIAQVMGADPRIGRFFLQAGCGYGGSCLPKDVRALIKNGEHQNFDFSLLKKTDEINERQKNRWLEKILNFYEGNIENKVFAIWGLAFKPNTDDVREAPAFYWIEGLLKKGVKVKVYDFQAMHNTRAVFGAQIEYGENPYQTLENSDALLIATEWEFFKHADLSKVSKMLKDRVIFDGRNIFDPKKVQAQNLTYLSVGRSLDESAHLLKT